MSDKPWKRAERKGAAVVGSVRTPLSGNASRHTRSDTLHPTIYLEMKYRKTFAILSQIQREQKKAKKEGKVAVLGLQQKGLKTRYYLIPEKLMSVLMEHLNTATKMEGL